MPETRRDRRWTAGDYSEFLAGLADPTLLRQTDARGLTPVLAASLDAGEKTTLLMTLLDAAASQEGESALDRIEMLLAEQVRQQAVIIERLNAITTLFNSRANRQAAWDAAANQGTHSLNGREEGPPEG